MYLKDLSDINTNLNTTELWVLQERVNTGNSRIIDSSSFCEAFTCTFFLDGLTYIMDAWDDDVTSIYLQGRDGW